MDKKVLMRIVLVATFIIACFMFYLFGNIRAVQSMTIKRVQPDQLANAMQADSFYSNYRTSTLIIKGQVSSIKNVGSNQQITFKTNTSYSVQCDLTSAAVSPTKNSYITAIAEGGRAQRETRGVLLVDCNIP